MHGDALHVVGLDNSAAFIAVVFSRVADDLDQAAAAIRAEFFVGDDGQGHYSTYMRSMPQTSASAIAAMTM